MKSESLAYAAAGTLVGFLGGWIIGSQHTIARAPAAVVAAAAPSPAAPAGSAPPAPTLDNAKVQSATSRASSEPSNPAPRIELGNLYFDAEQYQDAAQLVRSGTGDRSVATPTSARTLVSASTT